MRGGRARQGEDDGDRRHQAFHVMAISAASARSRDASFRLRTRKFSPSWVWCCWPHSSVSFAAAMRWHGASFERRRSAHFGAFDWRQAFMNTTIFITFCRRHTGCYISMMRGQPTPETSPYEVNGFMASRRDCNQRDGNSPIAARFAEDISLTAPSWRFYFW